MTTYKESGVNIDTGNQIAEMIKESVESCNYSMFYKHVLSSIGGFSAAFEIPDGYKHPVLVASTDGVGTKLKYLLNHTQNLEDIGIDLVAMCVNDIITCGARPLAFLDYYASSKLDIKTAEHITTGIISGCHLGNCPLVGGETAEMPGIYKDDKTVELAGFVVGVVEKEKMIDNSKISKGDVLIGIPSSGVHCNGYSLINYLLENHKLDLKQYVQSSNITKHKVPLSTELSRPTHIYEFLIRSLIEHFEIKGIANITGGGIIENVPRIIPKHLVADIKWNKIEVPEVFRIIQKTANLTEYELKRTFNCGIGMVLCTDPSLSNPIINFIKKHFYSFERSCVIGYVDDEET